MKTRLTALGKELGKEDGIYFIESLFAVFILSVGIISVSGLFLLSMEENAVAEDLTKASVLAQDKMEELMNTPYDTLVSGGDAGDLETSLAGYSDTPLPGWTRRWQVDVDAPLAGVTTVRVSVLSSRELIGVPKSCELRLVRSW